ncbi:alpha/beta fold hydrolase [Roseibacillus persicicus]|uniref:alpha/beta fold hydrolase n=1 Tax=Roseibacillus persicicus TaxID=454148 RepID=UPI00280CF731|nr:alpha/beta hydrolase [Roseibacillus persicicus]MDQ8190895.1 alpha/beta hydrolase [Roseibacillus persicicus]
MPLAHSLIGNADKPPLIFLHGLGASSQQITSALTGLPEHYLIAPDLPGHGGSLDYDPEKFSFDYFADLVIELLDSLGIESTDMGGLSMGSGIALNIALRYPERVKKIVVLRPSWLDEVEPPHLSLVARVGQWLQESGEEKATMNLALHPDYQELVESNVPVAESVTALLDRRKDAASTQVLFKMWQCRPFSSLDELSKVQNPVLVLDTTRDELHPQTTAHAIASALPNCQIHTLPPRYHEAPAYQASLNEYVREFLTQA